MCENVIHYFHCKSHMCVNFIFSSFACPPYNAQNGLVFDLYFEVSKMTAKIY